MITSIEQIEKNSLNAILKKAMVVISKKNKLTPVDAFDFPLEGVFKLKFNNNINEGFTSIIPYAKIVNAANEMLKREMATMEGLELVVKAS